MTHKVYIVAAGNRAGDTVRVKCKELGLEDTKLRRGEYVEINPRGSFRAKVEILCNPHGGDDTYLDYPQIQITDKPMNKQTEDSG